MSTNIAKVPGASIKNFSSKNRHYPSLSKTFGDSSGYLFEISV
jgi:hypothetical protein